VSNPSDAARLWELSNNLSLRHSELKAELLTNGEKENALVFARTGNVKYRLLHFASKIGLVIFCLHLWIFFKMNQLQIQYTI
jgi:hypothetical protein